MEKKYIKITNDNNKDIIYKIMIGDFEPVILRYCHNNVSNTYYGFRFECFIDGVKALLRTYPNFLLDVQDTYELNQWFKMKGFKSVEPSKTDLLIYNN